MRGVGFMLLLGLASCSNSKHSQSNGGLTADTSGAPAGGAGSWGGSGGNSGAAMGEVVSSPGGNAGVGGVQGGAAGDSNAGGAGIAGSGGAAVAGAAGIDNAADAGAVAQPIVKVMTFNIRYDTAEDGDDAWPIRKPLAFEVFTRQQADLVGVQEALDSQLGDIDGAVEGYSRIGVGRDDGAQDGEYSAVYYRNERFAVESSGTFWFSDTPEVPGSTSWGNDIPRICTWGHFADIETGYGVYLFNVHLDHQSQASREKSVALLMQRAADRPNVADPVIVTGDFNADEESAAIRFMKGEALVDGASNPLPLVDSFRALFPDETQVRTGHGFNGGTEGPKIDFIFMGPGQIAIAAEIDHSDSDGRYPSDHYPVTATLRLPVAP